MQLADGGDGQGQPHQGLAGAQLVHVEKQVVVDNARAQPGDEGHHEEQHPAPAAHQPAKSLPERAADAGLADGQAQDDDQRQSHDQGVGEERPVQSVLLHHPANQRRRQTPAHRAPETQAPVAVSPFSQHRQRRVVDQGVDRRHEEGEARHQQRQRHERRGSRKRERTHHRAGHGQAQQPPVLARGVGQPAPQGGSEEGDQRQ